MGKLTILMFLFCFSVVKCVHKDYLYPHGRGVPDKTLPPQDDVSSPELFLKTPIVFYNEVYQSIFINSNGILSLRTEFPTFFNIQFPLDYPVIAALYSNVDIRPIGAVYYRESQDEAVLDRATRDIRAGFSFARDFRAKSLLIVTWVDVGYNRQGADKTNTFQIIVITDGDDTYVELIYPDDGIQWIQGTGSVNGLPDARAQVGFISADGRVYTVRGSGTDQVQKLDEWSNAGNPGVWLFHVGKVGVDGNVTPPDLIPQEDEVGSEPRTCSAGSHLCHSKGHCVDYEAGFCCFCQSGYYGNGFNCLKEELPIRVNGKLSGVLNGINFTEVDLQAYVLTAEGRTYTAVSKVPQLIGYDTQSLNSLGSALGWLFAKPIQGALNGYQITGGVFNQTIKINFPQTGDQIIIKQSYRGLDVFDQLTMIGEVKGSIPSIPYGSKLNLKDYEEQYSWISSGSIIGHSSQVYQLDGVEIDHTYTVEQEINYSECEHSSAQVQTQRLKVGRPFVGYESTENIIRYSTSNKITPIGIEDDPCQEGRDLCGAHSTCVVEGDAYRCVCNPGYQKLYIENSQQPTCVDLNECTVGSHTCDYDATCFNNEGSYQCRCNTGYTGDGHTCTKELTCDDIRCGYNSECVLHQRNHPTCVCKPGYHGDGTNCHSVEEEREEIPTYPYPGGDKKEEYRNPLPRCVLNICYCPPGFDLDSSRTACLVKGVPAEEKYEDRDRGGGENIREGIHIDTDLDLPEPVCYKPDKCTCTRGYIFNKQLNVCQVPANADKNKYVTKGRSNEQIPCNVLDRCHPNAECLYDPSIESYECSCNPGFYGDGLECSIQEQQNNDEDSCNVRNNCHPNALCVYQPTSSRYACECNVGYLGNGFECFPDPSVADFEDDECNSPLDCLGEAECVLDKTSQKYECVCKSGFTKDPITRTCHSYDDVQVDASVPSTSNSISCSDINCHSDATCTTSSNNEYVCRCNPGFEGDGRHYCRKAFIGCNMLNNCAVGTADCRYDSDAASYRCRCKQGYQGDGITCSPILTCRDDPSLCGEFAACLPSPTGGYSCQCQDGYVGNGRLCKLIARKPGNFLLVNQGMATLQIPYQPTSRDGGRPIQIQSFQHAIGIDIDCAEGRVYWSDVAGHTIQSSNYTGGDIRLFITSGINSPEGISVDWLSRNIYWTDSYKDTIEVASLDNSEIRKVLISQGLVNPRGIAVHPSRGKLFWSDWNRDAPKIEWSNMDGSDRSTFLRSPTVYLPNSLAIDFETDELCWADAGTHKIECIGIGNRYQRTVATDCTYPFGLAISQDHYYWTDWETHNIERVTRPGQAVEKPIAVPRGGSGKMYGIVSVPDSCPRLSNICQYDYGKCPENHLCLPNGQGQRKCVCTGTDESCNSIS